MIKIYMIVTTDEIQSSGYQKFQCTLISYNEEEFKYKKVSDITITSTSKIKVCVS